MYNQQPVLHTRVPIWSAMQCSTVLWMCFIQLNTTCLPISVPLWVVDPTYLCPNPKISWRKLFPIKTVNLCQHKPSASKTPPLNNIFNLFSSAVLRGYNFFLEICLPSHYLFQLCQAFTCHCNFQWEIGTIVLITEHPDTILEETLPRKLK